MNATDMTRDDFLTTSAAVRAQLSAIGVEADAAQAIVRETAHARAQWRAECAARAAQEAVPADLPCDCTDNAAAALLIADLFGVGGRAGVEGVGTARVPALERLGKGRKHASDGAAWTAAIAEAANSLLAGNRAMFVAGTNASDEWALYFHVLAPTGDVVEIVEVREDLVPRAWQETIAREGLRRACGLQGWHDSYAHPFPVRVSFDETAETWAKIINRFADLRRAEEAARRQAEAEARHAADLAAWEENPSDEPRPVPAL